MRGKKDNECIEESGSAFNLDEAIHEYFNDVFYLRGFTIAVDITGLYLFTEILEQDHVLIQASSVLSELGVTRNEIVICIVNDAIEQKQHGFFAYSGINDFKDMLICRLNPDEFEDSLRSVVGGRPTIFDYDDIIRILEPYQDSCWTDTSLEAILANYNLPEGLAHQYEVRPPESIKEVISDGVDETIAEEVYQIVYDYYHHEDEEVEDEQYEFSYVAQEKALMNFSVGMLFMVAAMFFAVMQWWVLSLVFAFTVVVVLHSPGREFNPKLHFTFQAVAVALILLNIGMLGYLNRDVLYEFLQDHSMAF